MMKNTARSRREAGFTLIEFMIAMTMSLFCIFAMTSIYMAVKTGFFGQDSLSQMQESERLTISSLTNTIQLSGYYISPEKGNTRQSVFTADTGHQMGLGQYISEAGTTSAQTSQNNSISVRFQTARNDGILTCLGTTNTDSDLKTYTNTFTYDATQKSLSCTVVDNVSSNTATAVLANNINSFDVTYGVDANGDGSIDYYISGSNISAALWQSIKSVRITLEFANKVDKNPSSSSQKIIIVQNISIMQKLDYQS